MRGDLHPLVNTARALTDSLLAPSFANRPTRTEVP